MLDEGEFDVDLAIGPLRQSAWEAVRTWPRMKDAVHLVLTDLGPNIVQGKPRVLFPYSQSGVQMALLAERVAEAHVGEQVMLLTTGDRRNAEAEEAFQDGKIVTGKTWQSHPEFYRMVMECLEKIEAAVQSE